MRKRIYIFVFIIFGVSLGILIHLGIELFLITKVVGKTTIQGERYIAQHFAALRIISATVFIVGGAFSAVLAAPRCWHMLYIKKRFGTPWL